MKVYKLIILLLLTLGQAYPYAGAFSSFKESQECSCCQSQQNGCLRCATHGHGHSHHQDSNDQLPLSVSESPCHTPTEKIKISFVTENFIIPQFYFSKMEVAEFFYLKNSFTLQKLNHPRLKPPTDIAAS